MAETAMLVRQFQLRRTGAEQADSLQGALRRRRSWFTHA